MEAIYVTGVDDMSTQDVFGYFKEYPPAHIEWIDDTSCEQHTHTHTENNIIYVFTYTLIKYVSDTLKLFSRQMFRIIVFSVADQSRSDEMTLMFSSVGSMNELILGMQELRYYGHVFYIPTKYVCFVFCLIIVVGFRIRVHVSFISGRMNLSSRVSEHQLLVS